MRRVVNLVERIFDVLRLLHSGLSVRSELARDGQVDEDKVIAQIASGELGEVPDPDDQRNEADLEDDGRYFSDLTGSTNYAETMKSAREEYKKCLYQPDCQEKGTVDLDVECISDLELVLFDKLSKLGLGLTESQRHLLAISQLKSTDLTVHPGAELSVERLTALIEDMKYRIRSSQTYENRAHYVTLSTIHRSGNLNSDDHLKDIDDHWPLTSDDFFKLFEKVKRFRNHLAEIADSKNSGCSMLCDKFPTVAHILAMQGRTYIVDGSNRESVINSLTYKLTKGKDSAGFKTVSAPMESLLSLSNDALQNSIQPLLDLTPDMYKVDKEGKKITFFDTTVSREVATASSRKKVKYGYLNSNLDSGWVCCYRKLAHDEDFTNLGMSLSGEGGEEAELEAIVVTLRQCSMIMSQLSSQVPLLTTSGVADKDVQPLMEEKYDPSTISDWMKRFNLHTRSEGSLEGVISRTSPELETELGDSDRDEVGHVMLQILLCEMGK